MLGRQAFFPSEPRQGRNTCRTPFPGSSKAPSGAASSDDSAPTELGILLRTSFYKDFAPAVLPAERPNDPVDNRPGRGDAPGSVLSAPTGRKIPAQGKPRVGEGRRPGWNAQENIQKPQRGDTIAEAAGRRLTSDLFARPYRAPRILGDAVPGRRSPEGSLAPGCSIVPLQGVRATDLATHGRHAAPNVAAQ